MEDFKSYLKGLALFALIVLALILSSCSKEDDTFDCACAIQATETIQNTGAVVDKTLRVRGATAEKCGSVNGTDYLNQATSVIFVRAEGNRVYIESGNYRSYYTLSNNQTLECN